MTELSQHAKHWAPTFGAYIIRTVMAGLSYASLTIFLGVEFTVRSWDSYNASHVLLCVRSASERAGSISNVALSLVFLHVCRLWNQLVFPAKRNVISGKNKQINVRFQGKMFRLFEK